MTRVVDGGARCIFITHAEGAASEEDEEILETIGCERRRERERRE